MAADLSTLFGGATVAVNEVTATAITCPLANATAIQVYIQPGSTDQIYSIFPIDANGDAIVAAEIKVASGSPFMFRSKYGIGLGQELFEVKTATGPANLQVCAFVEQ